MKGECVYEYCGSTYINLTNRCNNRCDFCIRKNADTLNGQRMWLEHEPDADEVTAELEKRALSSEVVFCGYGEPTMRLDTLKKVAAYLKGRGFKTRLNTNGLADAQYKRSTAGELKGLIDTVSISLNAADAEKYDAVCHSVFGIDAYGYMLSYAESCVKAGIDTVMTVVDVMPAGEIEKCRSIAESIGARFRVRAFIRDNG